MLIKNYQFDVLYLDSGKAFDKVPHQRIISKLRAHEIGPELKPTGNKESRLREHSHLVHLLQVAYPRGRC